MKPNPNKIVAMLNLLYQKLSQMLDLGLMGYYWNYVKRYACIAPSYFEMISQEKHFVWDGNYQ
jgi:hypothetical protein